MAFSVPRYGQLSYHDFLYQIFNQNIHLIICPCFQKI